MIRRDARLVLYAALVGFILVSAVQGLGLVGLVQF